MRNGNFEKLIERLCASCDVVHGVDYLGAVIPHSATITHTDCNALKNDEPFLVLKRLLIDPFRPDSTLTMLTHISVW